MWRSPKRPCACSCAACPRRGSAPARPRSEERRGGEGCALPLARRYGWDDRGQPPEECGGLPRGRAPVPAPPARGEAVRLPDRDRKSGGEGRGVLFRSPDVRAGMIVATLGKNVAVSQEAVRLFLRRLPEERQCACQT